MVQADPHNPQWWISRADAVRHSESIEKAQAILLKAVEIHPRDSMVLFSLARYASVLGRITEAKAYLKEAIELNSDVRQYLLEHQDLEPVWQSICQEMTTE